MVNYDDETVYKGAPKQQEVKKQESKDNNVMWKTVAIGGVTGIVIGAATAFASSTIEPNMEDEEADVEGSAEIDETLRDSELTETNSNSESIPETDSSGKTFAEAFAEARAELGPGNVFTWEGRQFNTYTIEEWDALGDNGREEFMYSLNDENNSNQGTESEPTEVETSDPTEPSLADPVDPVDPMIAEASDPTEPSFADPVTPVDPIVSESGSGTGEYIFAVDPVVTVDPWIPSDEPVGAFADLEPVAYPEPLDYDPNIVEIREVQEPQACEVKIVNNNFNSHFTSNLEVTNETIVENGENASVTSVEHNIDGSVLQASAIETNVETVGPSETIIESEGSVITNGDNATLLVSETENNIENSGSAEIVVESQGSEFSSIDNSTFLASETENNVENYGFSETVIDTDHPVDVNDINYDVTQTDIGSVDDVNMDVSSDIDLFVV